MDSLDPVEKREFSEREYWEWRYDCNSGAFEFVAEAGLQVIRRAIDAAVLSWGISGALTCLEVGTGTSQLLSATLPPFSSVTCTDVCRALMAARQRSEGVEGRLCFQPADATQLPYANSQFQVVVEKGTLDALLCDDSAEGLQRAALALREMKRVASVAVLSVSYAAPATMQALDSFASADVLNGDQTSPYDYDCSRLYQFSVN